MSEKNSDDPIQFGKADPGEKEKYQARIDAAKGRSPLSRVKGGTPLGHVERPNIPVLDRAQLSGADVSSVENVGQTGVTPRPPGSPVIQPHTARQIEEFAAAQVQQQSQEKVAEEAKDEKKADEDIFDLFDFSGQQRSEADRILNNKKRRDNIEKRCDPMDFEDLIMKGEVRQNIPVIPNKFIVTFRSTLEQEILFTKAFMAKNISIRVKDEKKKDDEEPTNDQYVLEKFALCQLACGLVSINGKELPTHLDHNGDPNEQQFIGKLRHMSKMSGYIIADLGIQHYWFDLRVRKLLNADDLGNG